MLVLHRCPLRFHECYPVDRLPARQPSHQTVYQRRVQGANRRVVGRRFDETTAVEFPALISNAQTGWTVAVGGVGRVRLRQGPLCHFHVSGGTTRAAISSPHQSIVPLFEEEPSPLADEVPRGKAQRQELRECENLRLPSQNGNLHVLAPAQLAHELPAVPARNVRNAELADGRLAVLEGIQDEELLCVQGAGQGEVFELYVHADVHPTALSQSRATDSKVADWRQ